jgi:hypothetical protein
VLSAISQQIQAIQRALKDREPEIDLLGSVVKVVICYLFIYLLLLLFVIVIIIIFFFIVG